jgi:hypothetical protein
VSLDFRMDAHNAHPRTRVSLKTKVGSLELNRLLSDVRRRVEHEITFEGCERRIKYVASLSLQTKNHPFVVLVLFLHCFHPQRRFSSML